MNERRLSKQNITDSGLGPRRLCPSCKTMRGTHHGRIKMHYSAPGVVCPGSDSRIQRSAANAEVVAQ